jgi:hypothetical protein
MSIFDSILSQVGGAIDIKNLAAKVGIDPAMAETAIAALAAGHQAPTDTVTTAAAKSGIDSGILQQIGQSPDALKMVSGFLDKDGDGNPLNDLTGMASDFFKK